jgi:hypothetical protein
VGVFLRFYECAEKQTKTKAGRKQTKQSQKTNQSTNQPTNSMKKVPF